MKEFELVVWLTHDNKFSHVVLAANYEAALAEAWLDFPNAEGIHWQPIMNTYKVTYRDDNNVTRVHITNANTKDEAEDNTVMAVDCRYMDIIRVQRVSS